MTKHAKLKSFFRIVCLGAAMALGANGAGGQTPDGPRRTAKGPEESLAMLRVADGFEVQLVAAEPQIVDPVTARFDSQGRLWVVEMRDYPTLPKDGSLNGQIKVLTDEDDDGFFEQSIVFADQLIFPTGLQPFQDGVILTHAGKVSFLADTDGDLVCDLQQDWFTGFSTGNEQLRANHPTWVSEASVHVASGLRGGEVTAVDKRWNAMAQPISLSTRDFQFSPFGGDWTAVAGNSQYGFYQDDGLRNYVCSNRNPCDLLLAEPWQVTTNPLLPLASWTVNVMPVAEQSQVFPLVNAWTTSNLHAGTFTAACGVFRYESDLLATQLSGDFFACEPTGSLVQRYRTVSESILPEVVRVHENSEFLASTDPWFRPVDLLDGPDGALYVVDMHRAVIEHPDWMPDELKQREDMLWGKESGRIYRVVPAGGKTVQGKPLDLGLDTAAAAELVDALFDSNRWRRTTASRLIAERLHQKEREIRNALLGELDKRVSSSPTAANVIAANVTSAGGSAVGVSACMWLLESQHALTSQHLIAASQISNPSVRCQVIRLLAKQQREGKLQAKDIKQDESGDSRIAELITNLASDQHPRVRFQWLMEFAANAESNVLDAVMNLLQTSREDSAENRLWLGRALSLLSPTVSQAVGLRVLREMQGDTLLSGPLVKRFGWEGNVEILSSILQDANSTDVQAPIEQFVAGMLLRGTTWSRVAANLTTDARRMLEQWIQHDQQTAANESLSIEQRIEALTRLAADNSEATFELCRRLMLPQQPKLFVATLRILEKSLDPELPEELIGSLVELPPDAGNVLLQTFVRKPTWTPLLLQAIESQQIPLNLIDPTTRGRLSRHPSTDIAERFTAIAASRSKGDLQLVMQRYQDAVSQVGDVLRGKGLFKTHCGACHQMDGEGHHVGPDISDLRTQSPAQILVSILDPNAAIDANFYRYSVLTLDGQIIEGLLVDSDQSSVTIKLQQNDRKTIERDSIELFRTTGVSMMPEGFENQLSPEDMRDLITYLKRWRFGAGNIPVGDGD